MRCLNALAVQTYRRFEAVIVDDGSTDDTVPSLKDFAQTHPEIGMTVLVNEKNQGANPSRNRGIRRCRGQIVAFLDSDCVPEPNWLEKLIAVFERENVAAATGLVLDPPAANIYELTFKGTHRVSKAGPARRLVGCNMAVRREILFRFMFDEDYGHRAKIVSDGSPDIAISGRSDEEGLFLKIRAAGYEQLAAPEAIVLHDHHYNRRSFYRQALNGGKSAARLVYKFYLPHRVDMLPFMLAYGALPLGLVNPVLLWIPAIFGAAALTAITYNDIFLKGKTPFETLRSFPVLLAYYHTRLWGYTLQTLLLHIKRNDIIRVHLDNYSK